jgi:hypothetical protein
MRVTTSMSSGGSSTVKRCPTLAAISLSRFCSTATPDFECARTTEVSWDEQLSFIGSTLQDAAATGSRLLRQVTGHAVAAGIHDLHRAVHDISDEDGAFAPRLEPQNRSTGSVTGCRLQTEVFVDGVKPVPQNRLSCFVDRGNAVFVDQAVDLAEPFTTRVVRTKAGVIGGGHQVLGKGGTQAPIDRLRRRCSRLRDPRACGC